LPRGQRRRLRRLSGRPPSERGGPPGDAYELAVAALRRKERTTHELAGWLEERGCEPSDVEAAISALTEFGELDDERFARRFAEDKRELRGWGPERIAAALHGRGLPDHLVAAALAPDSPEEQIRRASVLLARRVEPLATDAERNRALSYLTRRGYDYEIAYEAIRSVARDAA
jgi:regulatory protein